MTNATVLIVDDSRFMRQLIQKDLETRGYNTETAQNGKEAVKAVKTVNPDVITMDVQMPVMNGIEAVERIMAENPTPIIMLSAHTEEDADITLDALSKGAVDFIAKPGGEVTSDMDDVLERLVDMIEAVSGVSASASYPPTQKGIDEVEYPSAPLKPRNSGSPVVVIGASTGGPRLIESVLRDFPVGLHARILVVQHMPQTFTAQFAQRLNTVSPYSIRESESEDVVQPGEVVVAAGNTHLRVLRDDGQELAIDTVSEDPRASITPSVDVTMLDAAENVRSPATGVVLTGMGNDGSRGLQMMKQAGAGTIAQDEETSTVFGMPRKAIESGAVDAVLPAEKIVPGIITLLQPE